MSVLENKVSKWYSFLIASCTIGLVMRLIIIVQSPEAILERYGSDDLFYYTETAKNVVAGNGISFDGIHPTSGVQPLWLVALIPFAQWFENPAIGLKVSLIMASFFALLTALLLPKMLSRAMPKNGLAIGAIAGSIWMLHPKILQVSFEGTEGSLAALAWLLSIWTWFSAKGSSRYYLLGFVLGLGVLARIDHLVLAALLWLFPLQNVKELVRKGFQMLPGIALLLGGWLLICWFNTGDIGMDSGRIKRLHSMRILALENGMSFSQIGPFSLILKQALGWAQNGIRFLSQLFQAESRVSVTVMTVIVVIAGTVLYRIKTASRSMVQKLGSTWTLMIELKPVLMAGTMVFLSYLVYLHYLRSWYLIPLFLCATMLSAAILHDLFITWNSSRKKGITVLLLFFGTFALMHTEAHLKPRKGMDPSFISALNQVKTDLKKGSTIGAFNAGFVGATMSPEHVVINLDGVVNHSVGKAIRDQELIAYMQKEKVEYIFDYKGSVDFFGKIGSKGFTDHLDLEKEIFLYGKDSVRLGFWKVDYGGNGE